MLAVRFAEHGDPSALRLDEVPEPRAPTRDQLLVRVLASSVNGTDLGLRRGDLKAATWGRMPFVPGFDLSGEVLSCGPAVTAFAPGDQVMALLGHSGGGLAERVLLRQGRAAYAPRTCSAAAAAALPLAGLTALQALGHAGVAGRPAGSRVLVLGAAGGIGSYAVQLAKRYGAHVTGVASGAKLPFVTGLGADEVVDYQTQDVVDLDGRWDVVLDAPGRRSLAELAPLLRSGGVLVSTRAVGPDALRSLVPLPRPRGRRYVAVMTRARSQDLARLATLVDRGQLRPTLDRTFPITEAASAHRHAESAVLGKVVVVLNQPAPPTSPGPAH